MFNWIKKVSNKLFGRKAEENLSRPDDFGPCDDTCDEACPARPKEEFFRGLEALVEAEALDLRRKMERDIYAPTYEVSYRVKQPAKKKKKTAKKKTKKKVQAVKGKYGSQKQASPRKKTKSSTKGN